MAIKGGQIIHVGNDTVVIDRIQTAGPGQLNIPSEKIYELGNYQSVATIRDTPDLSFSMQSLDMSTEIEQMLVGGGAANRTGADGVTVAADATFTAASGAFVAGDVGRLITIAGAGVAGGPLEATIDVVTDGTHVELSIPAVTSVASAAAWTLEDDFYDLLNVQAFDVVSQWKAGKNAAAPFDIIASVGLPYLIAESVSYRFGLHDNAQQTVGLRGDSIFYCPGAAYVQSVVGSGSSGQTVVTAHAAGLYTDANGSRRVLSVCVDGVRLTFGVDYTVTEGTVTAGFAIATVHLNDTYAATQKIRVMYFTNATRTYPQNVHADTTVKPAAVRGRDIDIYIGGYDPDDPTGSLVNKVSSVQSVSIDWRVTLDKDEEFGNYFYVAQDFDVPDVSGSLDLKFRSPADMQAFIATITGVDPAEAIGPNTADPLAFDVVIKDANNGAAVVKRLNVPDARFDVPGYNGQVQQKLVQTCQFNSDGGTLRAYKR
jgi:hypothetical protein